MTEIPAHLLARATAVRKKAQTTPDTNNYEPKSDETYVLAGYLRFTESDEIGVTAKVISKYAPQHAKDSDVPIYRKVIGPGGRGETKADLDNE